MKDPDSHSVSILLSNGTSITKRITAKRSELTVCTADGSLVPKPATFVQQLASGFAFDPLAFLEADKKKRAQYLLEAMPITFQPEEVAASGGGHPASVLNIETFEQYRAGVYERRRQANVLPNPTSASNYWETGNFSASSAKRARRQDCQKRETTSRRKPTPTVRRLRGRRKRFTINSAR